MASFYKRRSGGYFAVSKNIDDLINLGCQKILQGDNGGIHSYDYYFAGIISHLPDGAKLSMKGTGWLNLSSKLIPKKLWGSIQEMIQAKQIAIWKIAWSDDRY